MISIRKLLIFAFTFLALSANAYAQSPREQLSQMVQQLQQTPNDNALREKIIKFAAGIRPAPAIPEEARRHFVKAVTLQKEAKNVADFEMVVSEYQSALSFAPWSGDTYYNLSVALEASARFSEAKNALQFYLMSGPKDAVPAQDRIYALEAKQEKADREKSVYDWLLGEWRLNDELRTVGGGAFSPTEAVSVQSVKEGGKIIFRLGGKDFLRATLREQDLSWEHWKPIPYKPIGCPEDGVWNRVEVTSATDKKSMSFVFYESFTGTCGHQNIHKYVLSR
jgi:tetratricopeptide (TPR) repeat protein